MLATGSFDASVGVWRRWDSGLDLDPQVRGMEGMGKGEEEGMGKGEGEEEEEEDDSEEWRFALVLDGHDSEVKSVAWSAGGNLLATCSRDKSVWVWEEVGEDDFETVAVLQEHGGDVKCVAWHPEEELLASASYDDDVRLWREEVDDWGCVGVLRGHGSTVWAVGWEGVGCRLAGERVDAERLEGVKRRWRDRRGTAGPRLVSCSDDLSIRVWRRRPRERGPAQSPFSIIKSGSSEEDWVEEARMPARHERAVLSVAWSQTTGRIVSTGGDGRIIVYEERWVPGHVHPEDRSAASVGTGSATRGEGSTATDDVTGEGPDQKEPAPLNGNGNGLAALEEGTPNEAPDEHEPTEWVVVAETESAHDVFEVNHVCWARRADRGKRRDGEEVVVSTGDDGAVKVWTLDF